MHVLALDSTTRAGSAALLRVDASGAASVIEERAGEPGRTHAERLPGELTALLDAHGLSAGDIEVFAVASGPGSFTGLRIGIATMQGLALASGRPLVGVSALDALAEAAGALLAESTVLAAWMDAYRREVFTALYRREPARGPEKGTLDVLEGPRVGEPSETLTRWLVMGARPSLFIGGGAALYGEAIDAAVPGARIVNPPALASAVGRLAARRAAAGLLPHPAALQPLYIRRPDAELARDKAAHSE